jgi:hypothetical protein
LIRTIGGGRPPT